MASNGWFETFSPKRRDIQALQDDAEALQHARETSQPFPEAGRFALHPEVARLLQAGVYPKDMRHPNCATTSMTSSSFSPYVCYRWREGNHLYTISLGLLDDYPPLPFTSAGF
jgi:hypothetical protein